MSEIFLVTWFTLSQIFVPKCPVCQTGKTYQRVIPHTLVFKSKLQAESFKKEMNGNLYTINYDSGTLGGYVVPLDIELCP